MAEGQMARYWKAQGGPNWVAHEAVFDAFLAPFDETLQIAAAPQPGDHVLDVGSGFGTTTLAMARAVGPSGRVMAVDVSDAMIERLRERADAAGIGNVIPKVADVQVAELPAHHFHVAVSRMGVMFFDEPVVALTNIHGALRPDGRLVFACWQERAVNPWVAVTAAAIVSVAGPSEPPPDGPGAFSFADPERVRTILTSAGFQSVSATPVAARLAMGGDGGLDAAVLHATNTSEARRLLEPLDEPTRDRAVAAVARELERYVVDGRVALDGAGWIVTARA